MNSIVGKYIDYYDVCMIGDDNDYVYIHFTDGTDIMFAHGGGNAFVNIFSVDGSITDTTHPITKVLKNEYYYHFGVNPIPVPIPKNMDELHSDWILYHIETAKEKLDIWWRAYTESGMSDTEGINELEKCTINRVYRTFGNSVKKQFEKNLK